jgi:hypothetical protein
MLRGGKKVFCCGKFSAPVPTFRVFIANGVFYRPSHYRMNPGQIQGDRHFGCFDNSTWASPPLAQTFLEQLAIDR